jgi:hypothetical protein
MRPRRIEPRLDKMPFKPIIYYIVDIINADAANRLQSLPPGNNSREGWSRVFCRYRAGG